MMSHHVEGSETAPMDREFSVCLRTDIERLTFVIFLSFVAGQLLVHCSSGNADSDVD